MTAPAFVRRVSLPPGLSRWLKPLLVAALAVASIALLAAYVFPTRTWIDQRAAIAETEASLDALAAEREALEARVVAGESGHDGRGAERRRVAVARGARTRARDVPEYLLLVRRQRRDLSRGRRLAYPVDVLGEA